MAAFRVVSYSSAALADLLVDKSHGKSDDIRKKTHLRFLDEYFTEIGAATIVVEERYIDRDYLEDYAAYYARCFAEDRKSVVWGSSVSVRVDMGGRRIIKKKKYK